MLYYFTKKEVQVLKRILPTVKLNAYDIQNYQNIIDSLNNPYDQLHSKKSKFSYVDKNTEVLVDEPDKYEHKETQPVKEKARIVKKHSPKPVAVTRKVKPEEDNIIDTNASMFN